MSRRFLPPLSYLLLAAAPVVARGEDSPAAPTPAPSVAPGLPPGVPNRVGFCSARTTLWAGRTAVIPVRMPLAPGVDQSFTATTSDHAVVDILRDPAVLADTPVGFMRVRAGRPGRARLTMRGDTFLDVEVRLDPAAAAYAQVDADSFHPRIVTPMPGAVVWGQFAVGVEVFDGSARPAPNKFVPVSALKEPRVQLRLPTGRLLDPVGSTPTESSPTRHYQFTVQASDLPAGPARLVAVSCPAGFTDVDRMSKTPGSILESDPVVLNVQTPRSDALWSGECENPVIMGVTRELLAPARPPRYGTRQPAVAVDPLASGGKMIASPGQDPAWCLPFNVRQPGAYQLFIQSRGDYAVGAYPTVAVYVNNAEIPAGSVRLAGSKYHRLPVGLPIRLDGGPQLLTVQFKNDANADKEDRNFYLDRYELARIGDVAPAPVIAGSLPKPKGNKGKPPAPTPAPAPIAAVAPVAPAVSEPFRPGVLYPANGAAVYGVDAVVARVPGGPSRPAWVDVLVDGQPQGTRTQSALAAEPVLMPLLVRPLAPGAHRLAVRVADQAGQTVDSPERTVRVLADAPLTRGPYERAVHLLDRFAFGPDGRELAAVLTMGEAPWLDHRLAAPFDTPNEQALLRQASARFPRIDDEFQTAARALHQWINTENPVRSRFTAWTENHFTTWVDKVRAAPKWREHMLFSRLGVAPFADLLSASAHSPAMLVYLDQQNSFASKLNENYAREIMELHTLGVHGGYKQADVTALAGVLNGWTVAREAILPEDEDDLRFEYNGGGEAGTAQYFLFAPALNDGKPRRVFGMDFAAADSAARYDRVQLALEMLATHPSTAEHVCRKLVQHYVSVPASEPLVRALAQTFHESGGDMRVVLRALAGHPAFWAAPQKMTTPLEYGIRISRLCRAATLEIGGDPDQAPRADQVESFLKKSGMGLFDRVTPDGYPENSANYVDSNALLQRWHFMQANLDSLDRLVPKPWRTPPAPGIIPAANENPPPADDPAQRFVDLAAVRLTGRLLSPASNKAAREILDNADAAHMRQTILFISLLPESSLR